MFWMIATLLQAPAISRVSVGSFEPLISSANSCEHTNHPPVKNSLYLKIDFSFVFWRLWLARCIFKSYRSGQNLDRYQLKISLIIHEGATFTSLVRCLFRSLRFLHLRSGLSTEWAWTTNGQDLGQVYCVTENNHNKFLNRMLITMMVIGWTKQFYFRFLKLV